MRIYVASSWRNEARQQETVRVLREAGHEVYDFRHPAPGNEGFGWRFCSPDPAALTDPRRFRDEVLPHPSCRAGFDFDMTALRSADATVLVLPCGRSAHLELGYATGARQKTIVLFADLIDEPELMYLMNTKICVSLDEVVRELGVACSDCGGICKGHIACTHPPGSGTCEICTLPPGDTTSPQALAKQAQAYSRKS